MVIGIINCTTTSTGSVAHRSRTPTKRVNVIWYFGSGNIVNRTTMAATIDRWNGRYGNLERSKFPTIERA